MTEREESQTSSGKLSAFIEKNRVAFISVLVAVVVLLVAFIAVSSVLSKGTDKNLAAIDEISYTLTNESSSLEEAELNARRIDALDKLAAYTSKGGIVGARANLLCAELAYQQTKYEDALSYYKATAAKSPKSYLAPLAIYNAATCYEELNNLEEAAANYKTAADNKDFALKAHAKFSYGRVLEAQGKYADAVAAYTQLNDELPNDTWAKLAKTRIITLKAEGKAE